MATAAEPKTKKAAPKKAAPKKAPAKAVVAKKAVAKKPAAKKASPVATASAPAPEATPIAASEATD